MTKVILKSQYKMLTFTLTVILILVIFHVELDTTADSTLLLLHSANIHGQFEESIDQKTGNRFGGCARIAYVVREARKASKKGTGPPVLFLSSGNIYHHSSIWFLMHGDKICSAFMNALKPDVMSVGPRDFYFGALRLVPFLKDVKFPVVASNLIFRAVQKIIKESYVITLNGRKIGIVSYVKVPKFVVGNVDVYDEAAVLQRVTKELRENNGVGTIILLSNEKIENDIQIAHMVVNIDVVAGGHSDTFLWNGPPPSKEVPTGPYPVYIKRRDGTFCLIIHTHLRSQYLGKLLLSFGRDGKIDDYDGDQIFLGHEIPQASDILELLDTFRPDVERAKTKVVGQSKVLLDGKSCRRQECNMGNFIMDSFVYAYAKKYKGPHWSDIGLALLNVGAVRTSINATTRANNIFLADILTVLPYNNSSLYSVELNGNEILQSLEHGARDTKGAVSGGFLLGSGLRAVYDFSKPFQSRVESARIRCASCSIPKYSKLEPHKTYKLITAQFLIEGGDGHRIISEKARAIIPLPMTDLQAVLENLDRYKPVLQDVDRRIILKNLVSSSFRQSPEFYLLLWSTYWCIISFSFGF